MQQLIQIIAVLDLSYAFILETKLAVFELNSAPVFGTCPEIGRGALGSCNPQEGWWDM